MLKVALVQLAADERAERNLERTLERAAEAVARGAQLICLQELFLSRYFCQAEDQKYFDLAERLNGPSMKRMRAFAADHEVSILAPFFEKRAPGLYHNSAILIGPDGADETHYRKSHIPHDQQFYEKFYFAPGDTGFVHAHVPCKRRDGDTSVNVAPLICWDQWFPEAARACTLNGAEVLLYPTAIGWLPEEKDRDGTAQLSAWQTVQRAHAITNGVFVVATNRVGFEPRPGGESGQGIEFWGHSFVADPFGRVIAEAGEGEETLLVDLDLGLIEQARRVWPFLRDRRADLYFDVSSQYVDQHSHDEDDELLRLEEELDELEDDEDDDEWDEDAEDEDDKDDEDDRQ